MSSSDPFERAPYLFPWYVNEDRPRLVRSGDPLKWGYIEEADGEYVGLIQLLHGADILGFFKIYTYLQPSTGGDKFCIWKRPGRGSSEILPLTIEIYQTSDLAVIDTQKALSLSKDDEVNFMVDCPPLAKFSVPLNPGQPQQSVDYPDELLSFGDFIAVVEIDNLYSNNSGGTALIEIRPGNSDALIHPQDWFNQDERVDRGYEWITRAVRDPSSGLIIGDGIRINSFELDESCRQLRP